ncbi:MAG: translocation/assembly module TamB domain-containing protein [Deinococcaceae bacterium]
MLVFVSVLGLVSPLGTRWLLGQIHSPGMEWSAVHIGGFLWNPRLEGVKLKAPGVSGTARVVEMRYSVAALLSREFRFDLLLEGARLRIEPGKFKTSSAQTEWKVIPEQLSVKDVKVNFFGIPYTLPNGDALLKLFQKGPKGRAQIDLKTTHGQAQIDLHYQANFEKQTWDDLTLRADFTAQAILAQQWWTGVQGGEIKGTYTYQNGKWHGLARLREGRLVVPGVAWGHIDSVEGTVEHSGSRLDVSAHGSTLDGPVRAIGWVDYNKAHWNVAGDLKPRLVVLGRALNISELSGTPEIHVQASGWENANVQFSTKGPVQYGQVSIAKLGGTFVGGSHNRWIAQARLGILDGTQNVSMDLSDRGLGWQGKVNLTGTLLQEKLSLDGHLDPDSLSVSGQLFGSQVTANWNIGKKVLDAHWKGTVPKWPEATLTARFQGPLEKVNTQVVLNAPVPGLKIQTFRGSGFVGTEGLNIDFGVVQLASNAAGNGRWSLKGLPLQGGGSLSGAGNLDLLAMALDGKLSLKDAFPGASPLVGTVKGSANPPNFKWKTPQVDLGFDGRAFSARFSGYTATLGEPLSVWGNLRYAKDLGGQLVVKGPQTEVHLDSKKSKIALSGRYRELGFTGLGDLDRKRFQFQGRGYGFDLSGSYDQMLQFKAHNTHLTVTGQYKDALSLDLWSGATKEHAKVVWSPQTYPTARGTFSLDALSAWHIPNRGEIFSVDSIERFVVLKGRYQNFDTRLDLDTQNTSATLVTQSPYFQIHMGFQTEGELKWYGFVFTGTKAGYPDRLWRSRMRADTGFVTRGEVSLGVLSTWGIPNNGETVWISGRGNQVDVRGSYQNVQFEGQAQISPPKFNGHITGDRLSAEVTFADQKARLTARTGDALESLFVAKWTPEQISASGKIDLSVLQKPLGKDLQGTLEASVWGASLDTLLGHGQWLAQVDGHSLSGNLELKDNAVHGTVSGTWDQIGGIGGTANGLLYPTLDVHADVHAAGERAQVHILGPYDRLGFDLSGTTQSRSLGEFSIPESALMARGTLTPTLSLVGTWNGLSLKGLENTLWASGKLGISYRNEPLKTSVDMLWKPDWSGNITFGVQNENGNVTGTGPWKDIQVSGNWIPLQATLRGRLDLTQQTYSATVGAPAYRYPFQGTVLGKGTDWNANLNVSGDEGGSASVSGNLQNWKAELNGFATQNAQVSGALSSGSDEISGNVRGTVDGNPFDLAIRQNRLNAEVAFQGFAGRASAQLDPTALELSKIDVIGTHDLLGTLHLTGAYSGGELDLLGPWSVPEKTWTFNSDTFSVGPIDSEVRVSWRDNHLSASLADSQKNTVQFNDNPQGLSGMWSLNYHLNAQPGRFTLAVGSSGLRVESQGPLSGKMQTDLGFGHVLGSLDFDGSSVESLKIPQWLTQSVHLEWDGAPSQLDTTLSLGATYQNRPIAIRARGVLNVPESSYRASVSADVSGISPLIPRAELGQVEAQIEGKGNDLTAHISLKESRWNAQKLDISADAQLEGSRWDVLGNLNYPGLTAQWNANAAGLTLSNIQSDLGELLQNPSVQGTAKGELRLPNFDLKQLGGQLSAQSQVQGQSIRGEVTGKMGVWNAEFSGSISDEPWTLQGLLYPDAALQMNWKDFSGTVLGHWDGATLDLHNSDGLQLKAHWDGTTVDAQGRFKGFDAEASVRPFEGTGALSVQGDLEPATGQAGNLDLQADLSDFALRGTASGHVGDFSYQIPFFWKDALTTENARIVHTLGEITASGSIFPIHLTAQATSELYNASGIFSVSGSPADPAIEGAGTGPDFGLGLGALPFKAHYLGNQFTLEIDHPRLYGKASGQLFPLSVESLNLRPDLSFSRDAVTAHIVGDLSLSQRDGFLGHLTAKGEWENQPFELSGTGKNTLALSGNVGPGRMEGKLLPDLTGKLMGNVQLGPLDIGAFWGKPNALLGKAKIDLAGAVNEPKATLHGEIQDPTGDLSVPFSGSFDPTSAHLELLGKGILGHLDWTPHGTSASLELQKTDVSALLPDSVPIKGVSLSGKATWDNTQNLNIENLEGLAASDEIGPVSVRGSLLWDQKDWFGKLHMTGLEGTADLQGTLENLDAQIQNINLSKWNLGYWKGNLTLKGGLKSPILDGDLYGIHPEIETHVHLSGHPTDLALRVDGSLKGQAQGNVSALMSHVNPTNLKKAQLGGVATLQSPVSGTLAFSVSNLNMEAKTANVTLLPDLQYEGVQLRGRLQGDYPNLLGNVDVVSPNWPKISIRSNNQTPNGYIIQAEGVGTGEFAWKGDGWIPSIGGAFHISTLKPFLPKEPTITTTDGSVDVRFQGPIQDPTAEISGRLPDIQYGGFGLSDLSISGKGSRLGLDLVLSQKERQVGELHYPNPTASLKDVHIAGPMADLRVGADFDGKTAVAAVEATGNVQGHIGGTWDGLTLKSQYALKYLDYQTAGTLNLDAEHLEGSGNVSGLPYNLANPTYTLGGSLKNPELNSNLDLLGINAQLKATLTETRLTVPKDEKTGVQGEIGFTGLGETLFGKLNVSKNWPEIAPLPNQLEGQLELGGSLQAPKINVQGQIGSVHLEGSWTPEKGQASLKDQDSDLGNIFWDGKNLSGELKGFDLSDLKIPGYGGQLDISGQWDQEGQLSFAFTDVQTPLYLPYLELPIRGTAQGTWDTQSRLHIDVQTREAKLRMDAEKQADWSVDAEVEVHPPKGGTIKGRVLMKPGQAIGTLEGDRVHLSLGKTDIEFSGKLKLQDQDFSLLGALAAQGGTLGVSGDGALADVLPGLESFGFQKSDNGYAFEANLASVDLAQLQLPLPPHLSGRISGNALWTEGSGNIVLKTDKLTLAGENFAARLEGTFSDDDWRLRGNLGDSNLIGNVTDGILTANIDLYKAPLHALIGAFSGPLPGTAEATGRARYKGPVDNLLSGHMLAVAERISLSSNDEQLKGSGQLEYTDGVLNIPSIDFSGTGEWRISGEYSPQRADLKAHFANTTFTPMLALVPSLRKLSPELRGTLDVGLSGTYENPKIELNASSLVGELSGLNFKIPSLNGSYQNEQLRASGTFDPTGVVSGTSTFALQSRVLDAALKDTRLTLVGQAAIEGFGTVSDIGAKIEQDADRWTLSAAGKQGGTLSIEGDLYPAVSLQFQADQIAPIIPALYAEATELSATGTLNQRNERYQLEGNVDVQRYLIGVPEGEDEQKTKSEKVFVSPLPESQTTFPQSIPKKPVDDTRFWSKLDFKDIQIKARSGVILNENLARGEFAGGLILSGTGSSPRLSGNFISLRGTVFLRENAFVLDPQKTQVTFDPAEGIYPHVTLVAKGGLPYKGDVLDLTIEVQGQFVGNEEKKLQLETRLRLSDPQQAKYPQLTEEKLYALLVFGTDDLQNLPTYLGQSALKTAINVFFLGELERGLAKALDLSSFKINTNVFDNPEKVEFELALGKYITKDFYLEYHVDLNGKSLLGAQYTTEDGRFNFKVTSPLQGIDWMSARPSFAVGFNFNSRSSLEFGVHVEGADAHDVSTRFTLGYQLNF